MDYSKKFRAYQLIITHILKYFIYLRNFRIKMIFPFYSYNKHDKFYINNIIIQNYQIKHNVRDEK